MPRCLAGLLSCSAVFLCWFGGIPLAAQRKTPPPDSDTIYYDYDSLADLVKDLKWNVLRREQLVVPEKSKKNAPVITIYKAIAVSVQRKEGWDGVVVSAYDKQKGTGAIAVVYIEADMVDERAVSIIRRDGLVTIVGSIYRYETTTVNSTTVDAVSFYGVVMPQVKQRPTSKRGPMSPKSLSKPSSPRQALP